MSSNASAFAALDAHLDRLRRIPDLVRQSTPDVSSALKRKLDDNVARGVDPYGAPLRPTKDGRQPLKNAGARIAVRPVGTTVLVELTGDEVRHHVGSARGYHGGSAKLGGFRRPLIPWRGLPGPIKAVIREVLDRRFVHLMRGGR